MLDTSAAAHYQRHQAQSIGPTHDPRKLAQQINEAVAAAERSAKSAMMYVLQAGALLNDAKRLVPHGEWGTWLTTNCTLAPRTAQAYMRLAKKMQELPADEAQRVADLPVREAVRAIATTPEAPPRIGRIRAAGRDDATRTTDVFKKTATELRKAAKYVAVLHELKAQDVQALRNKLQAALSELDRLSESSPFETAVATAKATAGEVTTAFMLRQAKKVPQQKRPRAERIEELRSLVNSGHSPEQVADATGISVGRVRKLLSAEGIKVPIAKRGRAIDPNKIVRESVAALSGISQGLSLSRGLDIDATEAEALLSELRMAMKALRALDTTLKDRAELRELVERELARGV